MQDFPLHFHDRHLAGFLTSGLRRAYFGGSEKLLKPWDLFICPAGASHACRRYENIPCDWICVYFKTPAKTFNPVSPFIVPAGAVQLAPILSAGDGSSEIIFRRLSKILAEIASSSFFSRRSVDERLESFCRFLERKSADGADLGEMSRAAGMDKYKLTRWFGGALGITPYRYQEILRLNRAKNMLAEGAIIAAAALDNGFYDQSHFTRFFGDNLGFTPGVWRDAAYRKAGRS